MIIDFDRNFVFLKDKKVAGTTAEIFLRPYLSPTALFSVEDEEAEAILLDSKFGLLRTRRPRHLLANDNVLRAFVRGFTKPPKLLPHAPASTAQQIMGKRAFRQAAKVSVWRNPYDRLVSLFFWQHRDHHQARDFLWVEKTFPLWAKNGVGKVKAQFDRATKIDGQQIVTHWISFDRLHFDLRRIVGQHFAGTVPKSDIPIGRVTTKAYSRPEWASTERMILLLPDVGQDLFELFEREFVAMGEFGDGAHKNFCRLTDFLRKAGNNGPMLRGISG
jgi:hypothetical protein